MKKFNLLGALLVMALELVACNSGGGDPNNVPKQNDLPQVACSASFGGGWESSGTISYNPPLSPQNLGYINQYVYYDNRPSRVSYLDATYADSSGDWNKFGAIDIINPVYGISGGTSVQNNQYTPSQLPAEICTYMYSVEEYSSNNGVVPNTVNHGVMAWKNCAASITNGVMTFSANYELYLSNLNTAPVKSGTVTFTCNNINNVQPLKPLPRTSTSSTLAQTINGYSSNFAKYIDSLRNASTKN